ncbi:protein CLAVATA 3-like [Helianthus annuus]|uniref:protein CLAVATA 3-like n=1 Tax=Helianthus annuus TaxID=4232 RepID=UPI001652EEA1|nr:protein CLAVATA 3-like [Helianthus annuus]
MAFEPKSLSVSFLLLLCLFLVLQLSDGAEATTLYNGSILKDISNRKLLVVNGLEAKEAVLNMGGKSKKEEEEEEGWELRAAPLGPDPLHHHGADPQKPRTP